MTTCAPGVDAALAIKDVDYDDLLPVAAVPVPVLYSQAQAAMASGAWAEAGDLLREVVRLEPGFGRARELLAQVRRAHHRATRRKRIVAPWPVVISAAALVLVPVATGLATGLGTAPRAQVAVEPVSVTVVSVPTAMPTVVLPPPAVAPAPPTGVPAGVTAAPVVVRLPTVRLSTPTVLRLAAPTLAPTPTPEPTVAKPTVAEPTVAEPEAVAEPRLGRAHARSRTAT